MGPKHIPSLAPYHFMGPSLKFYGLAYHFMGPIILWALSFYGLALSF
jgi:hypothetical protein